MDTHAAAIRFLTLAQTYLHDKYLLAGLQMLLAGVCALGVWKDMRLLPRLVQRLRRSGVAVQAVVTRGPESRRTFHLAYGLLSVILLQLINAAEAGAGYKVLISVSDLAMLLYLLYYNTWMRSKIVAVSVSWQKRGEVAF